MTKLFYALLVVSILFCQKVFAWRYGEIDQLLRSYTELRNNDTITFENVIQSLDDNPRSFNATLCRNQFKGILKGILDRDKWAMKVFDSWGQMPPKGLLWGRTVDVGNYDECMSLAHDFGNPEDDVFLAQHCLITVPVDLFLPIPDDIVKPVFVKELMKGLFVQGICIPDTCSTSDLLEIVESFMVDKENSTIDRRILDTWLCTRQESKKFGTLEIVAIIVFATLGLVLILSTAYEYMADRYGDSKNQILISFSVITNARKLFKIRWKITSDDSVECINGIRCLSMVWIIWGHIHLDAFSVPLINYSVIYKWFQRYDVTLILSGLLAVDTFFFLSGFLVTFHILKLLEKRGKLTIPEIVVMYMHRYLRLFPSLAATILFVTAILPYMGDGPFWNIYMQFTKPNCETYWWSALLHLQNYVNPTKICLEHSWYLSPDFQLYVLSPFLLIPLHRWGRKFIWIIVLLIALCVTYTFVVMYDNQFNVRFSKDLMDPPEKMIELIHYGIQTKGITWLVGVIWGYLTHKCRTMRPRIPKIINIFIWLCSLVLLLVVAFGPYKINQTESDELYLEGALYKAFSTLTWGLALGWIIFACYCEYGGWINSFLSHPIWQPFGRLTYGIYMTHYMIQVSIAASARTDMHFSTTQMVCRFWAVVGFTIPISILMVLSLESPIIALSNLLLRRRNSSNDDKKRVQTLKQNDLIDNEKYVTRH